jgi:3-phosphoshikimate 1-carboxyvinyltransferase
VKVKVCPPKNLKSTGIQLPVSKSVLNRYLSMLYLSGVSLPSISSEYPNDVQLMHSLLQFSDSDLNVEDAGTVMRFGLALCCVTKGSWIIKGSERMHDRPISMLVDALRQLGANIEYLEKENYPPLRVEGQQLTGGRVEIDASVSSQFISALLMIAPKCQHAVEIVLTGKPVSSPYVSMTCSMMERFNVGYQLEKNVFRIQPQTYKFYELNSVLDWSAASFFYETLVLGDHVELNFPGLFKTGLQGDERVSELFKPLGIETIENAEGTKIIKKNKGLTGLEKIDFIDVPDLVQPLVCTFFGLGLGLNLSGLYNLHIKESDRLQALVSNLKRLGAELSFEHTTGLLKSASVEVKSNELDACKDHRMAMSLAPLCLKFGELEIGDAQTVSKSFPKFWNELTALGFEVAEIN